MEKLSLVFAAALALALAGAAPEAQAAPPWKPGTPATLKVAAGQPNQSIYAIHVGHKKIIEAALPGVRLELFATQGGDESIQLMQAGEAAIGSSNSVAPYSAHYGKFISAGKKPDPMVLAFFPGYTWEVGLMVRADSPINTFRDIVGKRIATGPVGSGVAATFGETLSALGLSDASFNRVQRSAPAQGFNNLAAGSVDGLFWGTAHPAGIVLEKNATTGLKFVSIDRGDLEKVAAAYPYYHAGVLPANTYDKQARDVAWVGGSTHFWVYGDVDENLVYHMFKALWENRATLHQTHASQRRLDESLVQQQSRLLPFHPGAQRYIAEKGLVKAAAR